MTDVNFTSNKCAKLLGLDPRTIKKRIDGANLKPVGKEKGYPAYNLGEVARVCFAVEEKGNTGYEVSDLMPKDRKDHFSARKVELEVRAMEGELVEYDSASVVYAEMAQDFSKFFSTLVDDLEQTTLFTPEQLQLIEQHCDEQRKLFAERCF